MARKATWQHHADPRAEEARTCVHANARVAPRGKCVFGLAGDEPTGIVVPGKIIRVVTQRP